MEPTTMGLVISGTVATIVVIGILAICASMLMDWARKKLFRINDKPTYLKNGYAGSNSWWKK